MRQDSARLLSQVSLVGLAALMLGQASQGLTFTAFNAALPQMAQTFAATGHGMAIAQQAVTIAAFGVIAGAFLSGRIVELLGTRLTILCALGLFGVAGAGGLFLQSAWALLASRVVAGFASACLITACITTLSTLFEGSARAKALGISAGMGAAASFIGLLLGGVLAQRFGWQAAFAQFPVFAAAGIILALAGIRDNATRTGPETTAQGGTYPWLFYLLVAVISAVMFMGSSQLAFLLPQDGVTSATGISHIMAIITLVAVPVSFTFGTLEHRLGLNGALVLGLAANAAGLALIGLVPSVPASAVGAALMGVYVGIVMPYIYHAVTVRTAPAARAKAIGMTGAFNFLGAFLNPFIFGPLGLWLGMHGMFAAVGGFMAVLALGAAVLGRRHAPMPSGSSVGSGLH